MNTATAERVRLIIARHFAIKPNSVVDETRFRDLGADWLDCLEVLMAIGDQLPELQTDKLIVGEIETVADLIQALEDVAARFPASAPAKQYTVMGHAR